jgi:hypothetical protein
MLDDTDDDNDGEEPEPEPEQEQEPVAHPKKKIIKKKVVKN